MSRSHGRTLVAFIGLLLTAACAMSPESHSGSDTRSKQERPLDQPDGMKGGGGSGGGGM
jgi:hypothetical protein